MLSRRQLQAFSRVGGLVVVFSVLMLCSWIFRTTMKLGIDTTSTFIAPPTFPKAPALISPVKDTKGKKSVSLSPRDLMSRPLSADRTNIPKLFHQSWKNSTLPTKFQTWSRSCRVINSDWEYVLWTDDDNTLMVKKYAPWFLETFEKLPEPIERADTARNLYMYIFGGVYADLDTECLRPYSSLFAKYGIPSISHQQARNNESYPEEPKPQRKAFLGRMHPNKNFHSGLPNAWMASPPAHPFWVLPLEYVSTHASDSKTPEFLTGPDALFDVVKNYQQHFAIEAKAALDGHLAKSIWDKVHDTNQTASPTTLPHSLEVLAPENIFPFSWADLRLRRVCWAGQPSFDSETCKDVLNVDRRESYSISYFSHSWGGKLYHNDQITRSESR